MLGFSLGESERRRFAGSDWSSTTRDHAIDNQHDDGSDNGAATKREQQPFVYGSLSKEAIYLKPLASPTTVIAPTTTNAPPQVEQSQNAQKRDPANGGGQNP
jgi:hypothetical protein